MKLITFAQEPNQFTTTVGIFGSVVSVTMPYIDTISRVTQCIGSFAGAILAVWAVIEKIRAHRKKKLLESIPPKPPEPDDIPFN